MTCAVHLGQAAKQPLFLRGRVRLSCHQDSSKLLVDARVIACVGDGQGTTIRLIRQGCMGHCNAELCYHIAGLKLHGNIPTLHPRCPSSIDFGSFWLP